MADSTPGAIGAQLALVIAELRGQFPERAILTDPIELSTYECDGLAHYRARPGVAVLAESAADVGRAVRTCVRHGVPFVARGSGTGLSGGALPRTDGVLIVMSRMREIRQLRPDDQRAVVDPGVINLDLSRAAEPAGYYYAPDPSSQQVCSIGGNVAENSGGAHCLKYGFTTNHVLSVDLVTGAGEMLTLGSAAPDEPGYDLLGVVVGSEGTLGVVTSVTTRLVRHPEMTRTILAAFATADEAGTATSAIIAAGLLPAAIEIMDALAIEAATAAVACDYPAGAGAVLIVELDGPAEEVTEQTEAVLQLCARAGTFAARAATSAQDRALIWKGRKSAFAAVGRLSPDYIVQDGVIPRTYLPEALRRISEIAEAARVRVANVFHAGDGNLHPLVLFDGAVAGQAEAAERVSGAILEVCVAAGGSITGEHGVGSDKAAYMPTMYRPADLQAMQLLRCAFDPQGVSNPGKIFPTPRLCGERPARRSEPHPLQSAGLAEIY
jgi:glycolate oxidase